ncbi:interferon alpha-inducible protein 27-like protein 2B [Pteropus medius]|uniref:interferon alpha-inducible protein 27-like protein 2B n=1 Tax=Pteropus vampyrus TaxID=132908 RepID=UPI00196A81C7|nr:interferon alpha-inducible protein 27-like protein 2B [Pteropus giganteus]
MQGIATSFLAKMISSVSLANSGGVASSSILAGLPSVGLPLPSEAVLASTVSTLGSLLGTLEVFSPLSLPAEALSASPLGAKAAAVVIGGAVAVGAVPVVLGAIGFTGAGITASSLAAKMMSASAIANGGGVAAGSLVATLQSVGAAGLSLTSKLIVGSAGSALMGYMV